jgi:serine protease Do
LTPAAAADQAVPSPADLIAHAQPAVVNLSITKQNKVSDRTNPLKQPSVTERKVLSSGFLIDESGVIVTNRRVVDGATDIIATFNDNSQLRAHLLSSAAHSDIALLKVNAPAPLERLQLGDSDRLRPGDPVLVIGNPLGLGNTVTAGVVSAVDRVTPESEAGSFIQIDAALNKGNSGGPVLNINGAVVGVSTAFESTANEGGSVGLGFAIPSNEAALTIDRLRASGRDTLGWTGIHIQAVTAEAAAAASLPEAKGSIVTEVDSGSPAARAGLGVGDIILAIGDENTPEPRRLAPQARGQPDQQRGARSYLAEWEAGNTVGGNCRSSSTG